MIVYNEEDYDATSFCSLNVLESWTESTWAMSKPILRRKYLVLDMLLYSVCQYT